MTPLLDNTYDLAGGGDPSLQSSSVPVTFLFVQEQVQPVLGHVVIFILYL
jgi:hypothetical protein